MPLTISNKPSALQEILSWSQSSDRPEWQRDALRRIITGKIGPSDVEELEKLCRAYHGALDAQETAPAAIPLKTEHIPAETSNRKNISLVSLGELQNVNRLPTGQTLSFGAMPGLTVIYGDNGAGKSGYARVIKKACRVRGQVEPIEPNAFGKASSAKVSAQFVIHDGTSAQPPITWQDSAVSDVRLGQIFLFDSASADHYVRENEGTTFTPFGLDVLDKLSRLLCDPIQAKLKERSDRISAAVTTAKSAWRYKPNTAVGKLVSGLSAKTKTGDVDTLTNWSEENENRLIELQSALAADPRVKSEQTRAMAQRIRKFRQSAALNHRALSPTFIGVLRRAMIDAQEARAAAQAVASGQFDEPSFLPGTGGAVWKSLWNSAREYSTKAAYKGQDYPVIEGDAQCVLCQSKLDADAKTRLQQFDEYIKNTASQFAEQKEAALATFKRKYTALPRLAEEQQKVAADLTSADMQLKALLDSFVAAADARLHAIQKALDDGSWQDIPILPVAVSKSLRVVEKNFLQQAAIEVAAANPEARKGMECECDELADRKWLSTIKNELLQQIERYTVIERLKKCSKDTGTTAITLKNKELTQTFVTDAFCKQFEEETKALGLRTLKVKLQPVDGKKGVTKFGVRLQDAENAQLAKIGSEGEKRCIALALFLAELSQASHNSTLVFDDPVSSLDHGHKEKTAQRLVEESAKRQVIVFTHDTVLLHELQTAAEQKNVIPHTMYLEWNSGVPGHCVTGLPWDWKSAADRFDKMEKEQRTIAAAWNPTPNEENKRAMREAYSWLRATLERMTECNILADTVIRFRKEVKVSRLEDVIDFSQEEYDELSRLHKRCHDITEAHDQSQARNASIPTPEELAQDIAAGKALLEMIGKRKKRVRDARKAKESAAA